MQGKRHTEEQIIAILKQSENGLKTAEVCRQHAENHGRGVVAGQSRLEGRAVKKLVGPAGRREAARYVEQTYRMSQRGL